MLETASSTTREDGRIAEMANGGNFYESSRLPPVPQGKMAEEQAKAMDPDDQPLEVQVTTAAQFSLQLQDIVEEYKQQ